MKLEPGDKVWTDWDDDGFPGWAKWNGKVVIAECGGRYSIENLALYIENSNGTIWMGYHCFAEQLFGDGTWDWPL